MALPLRALRLLQPWWWASSACGKWASIWRVLSRRGAQQKPMCLISPTVAFSTLPLGAKMQVWRFVWDGPPYLPLQILHHKQA